MRPLPLSLWLLVIAQIEARAQEQDEPQSQNILPTAIRKMPPDRGAKFHHEYCAFPDHIAHASIPRKPRAAIAARSIHEADDALRLAANASAELLLRPPFALLSGPEEEDDQTQKTPPAWLLFRRAASALARLEKRQWSCPSGTASCASVGFPNSCCQEGETCVEVPDTGLGPVGCCPAGATCGGGVSGCAGGATACGSEIGGGCCIPGFVCEGVGCVRPAPSPSTTPLPSLTTLTTTSTSIITFPSPSTVLTTVVITITPSTSPKPITSTVTKTRTASNSSPTTSSNSNPDAGAPYRPTSSPSPTSSLSDYCPTGYYPCLARPDLGGGCCQTGRDCASTTCPPATPMTTIVQGGGVTVVVPAAAVPSGYGDEEGECASGWFLCGEEGGEVAGCCPRGYSCGRESCSVENARETGVVGKVLPGSNGGGRVGMGLMGMGVVWGLVMMMMMV